MQIPVNYDYDTQKPRIDSIVTFATCFSYYLSGYLTELIRVYVNITTRKYYDHIFFYKKQTLIVNIKGGGVCIDRMQRKSFPISSDKMKI